MRVCYTDSLTHSLSYTQSDHYDTTWSLSYKYNFTFQVLTSASITVGSVLGDVHWPPTGVPAKGRRSAKMSSDSCPKAIVNLKAHVKTYAEHSTIKFLPRLIRAKSKIHKVLWIITFIIGTSVASYLLAGLLKTYTSFEKTLSVTAEEGARPPFPDVTLCNLNPLWNHADGWGLLARVDGVPYQLRYDQYIYLLYKTLHSSEGGGSTFERTNPEMYSVSGYLKHTEYDQETLDKLSEIFIWKCLWENGKTQKECVINATVTPTNGLCYTIRPPTGEGFHVKTREEGLSVILFLNNTNLKFVADYRLSPFESYTEGVKVYLHSRGTAPEMNRGFTVAPGTEASVVAKHHTRKLLKEPYGDCKEMELDTFSQFDPRSIWKYTQYACRSLCYQDKIIQKCGCVDSTEITFDDIVARYTYCSIFSLTDLEKALVDLNCSREVKAELDANGTCNAMCSHSCQHTYYDTYINQVMLITR